MGKIITPKYRVEYRSNLGNNMMPWDGKRDGRANETNLERWRKAYNVSFNPGGSNWHASQSRDVVEHISYAAIVEQRTGNIVAETRAPMFEVV